MKKILFFVVFFLVFSGVVAYYGEDFLLLKLSNELQSESGEGEVRLGYFHGGRTNMIYRAYIDDYFKNEQVDVGLYTKNLNKENFFNISDDEVSAQQLAKESDFGKVSGEEIISEIINGRLDGGTVGESSFISAISKGDQIVAVASLGHMTSPARAILIRSDLDIKSPADFKGRTLIARRAGPGDGVLLREFAESIGLDPDRDLNIIEDVSDDDSMTLIKNKKIDGGLYHLLAAKYLIESGMAKIHKLMDWVDPGISHALLVFSRDYIKNNPDKVQKIINAYVGRIEYEFNLPEEEKNESWDKGLMMEGEFEGMSIPKYDLPPKLKPDKLNQMQNLLLKHGEIDKKINTEDYLDHSFVEEAMKALEK